MTFRGCSKGRRPCARADAVEPVGTRRMVELADIPEPLVVPSTYSALGAHGKTAAVTGRANSR